MFQSTVLDLAVGMIFCFLTASLTTGAMVEAISSMISRRAKTLLTGIQQLLNDEEMKGLAGQLYAHASINPLGPGTTNPAGQGDGNAGAADSPSGQGDDKTQAVPPKIVLTTNMPSYIDRQLFARAMMDITGISYQVAAAAASGSQPSLAALHGQVATTFAKMPNKQIHDFLAGVIDRSFGDGEKIQAELAAWFDHAMDRVSGFYKRWTQWVGFVVALILAAAFNIDAVSAAKALWMQPAVAEALKAEKEPTTAGVMDQLGKAIPIGWPNGIWSVAEVVPAAPDKPAMMRPRLRTATDWGLSLVGWLITALSTLFGAPFWFDLLQNVIRLKGSGPSPKEKVDGTAGSA